MLLFIRIYWLIPIHWHNKCIFRESCSHYVYRITKKEGFIQGIKAFIERNYSCRPGYFIYRTEGKFFMKTANGHIYGEEAISPLQLPPNNMKFFDFDNIKINNNINNSSHGILEHIF